MAEITFEKFDGGLNTDKDVTQLQSNEATVLQDVDVRDLKLKKLPGAANRFDSLPTGFTPLSMAEGLFTAPSPEQQVTIVYGQDGSSNEKLYVRPYVNLSGIWVDAWLEITEREGTHASPLIMDAGSNTTTIVDAALSSSTDNYYNQWIVFNKTRLTAALVTDYVGSTNTLTVKPAIGSQTTGDEFWIVRHPIYNMGNADGVLYLAPKDVCRFRFRENAIEILTGNNGGLADKKTDLWLGYVNYTAFDDSDLNFRGLLCEPNNLGMFVLPFTLGTPTEPNDPLSADDYIVQVVPLYDGFQQGLLNPGEDDLGLEYLSTWVAVVPSGDRITVNLSIDLPYALSALTEAASSPVLLYWHRRITALRIYIAQADAGKGGNYEPTSRFRLVKEIDIDDTAWSGTGPYTQSIEIYGRDFSNNVGEVLEYIQGHSDTNIHAKSEFSAFVGSHLFLGSVDTDKQRNDFILQTPISGAQVNTPDVKAHSRFIDTSIYGIPQIMGMTESLGRLIVLGENRLLRITPTIDNPIIEQVTVQKGIASKRGIAEANGIVYFAGLDNIFAFNSITAELIAISEGRIRDAWQGFTTAQKQGSVLGYDRNRNCVAVSISTTTYLFWIDRGVWTTFTGLNHATYGVTEWFTTGYDGELIAIMNDGSIFDVFAGTPTENTQLQFQSGVLEGPLRTRRLRIPYNGSDNLTANFYDAEKSTTVPMLQRTYGSQSTKDRISKETSNRFDRLQLSVQSDASTNIDQEIEKFELEADGMSKE
jgi:hypothetical protein